MLIDTNGNNIKFKFYGSDETTVLTDANVTIVNLTSGRTVYRQQLTDSDGEITFFLNPNDANYQMTIQDNTGTFVYTSGILRILVPKNITNLVNVSPFDIEISGILNQSFTGLTSLLEM